MFRSFRAVFGWFLGGILPFFLTLFDVLSVFECFGCCSLFMSGFWVVFECFRAFIERPVFGYTAEQTCV